MEIKKSFVLDSARTWLKIWNRVERGRFTIQGQKGNEIGRVVPKLSTISWRGIYAEPCKNNLFFQSSSHGAAHPSRACRNMRFSTQTFVANLLPYIYLAPSVQKMRPIEDWMPPSAAGKDAAVGGLRATYAHATAHLRCSLPHHISNKRLRLIDCAPIFAHSRVLGARLDQSASGQRRMHADYTGTLGWNTCTSPT